MPVLQRVSRLQQVPGIGVDRMGNAADGANDPEILRLENLDTDIAPPKIAVETTRQAVGLDESNSYLPFLGLNELRQAATARVSRVCGKSYDWQSQCVITAGGMSGILNCLLAMVEPGDEVIVTDPVYAGVINRIRIAGGVVVFAPLIPSEKGWRLDIEAFRNAVSPRTRMVVMSPGMPSGHVLTEAEWQAVADVCNKNDLWLLYDAAMERILYDGRTVVHPASFSGMYERTVTVGAATKELRMIGWRVGWVVGPQPIMSDIGLVSISNVVCQVGIAMSGAAAALNAKDDGLNEAVKIWQKRRDVLLQELQGLPVIPPHGGWSMLLDTVALGLSPQEVSQKLFKQAKVAATPMAGWGPNAARYLRFVFSNEAAERLAGVGEKIKKCLL
jgi:aspartate/methionine/tyrosine aminotransferase